MPDKYLRKHTIFLLLSAVLFYRYCTEPPTGKSTNTNQSIITLGQRLFFDPQLSATRSKSCASCHNPQFAFTDGYRKTLGAFADIHARNTPGLINATANKYFNWANPSVTSLEQQMEQPLFSHQVIEMGLQKKDTLLLNRFMQDSVYAGLFSDVWPEEKNNVGWKHIKKAIAAYVAAIKSCNSPYDRYMQGDSGAISTSAKKGMQLFFSGQLKCSKCHIPPYFGVDSSRPVREQFYNIGLYNLPGGNYASGDNGLFNETGILQDKGKFRVPTLRNLSFTAPYFHDGSAETLQDVLQVFEKGGRIILKGVNKGDGRINPFKDSSMTGYSLTDTERLQLVNFLLSLDDSTILQNPLFSDPFQNKKN